jgi:centromere/kinetochore protein ZW10
MTNTLNSKEPHAVGNRILESISTIADFADGQAGETYTERRVEAALEEVKKLVLGGWGGWDAMEVQKEREEIRVVLVEEEVEDDAAKLQQSIVPQSQLHDETAAAGEADGWGLDDVLEAPSSSPTDTKVSGKTAAPDAGDADEAGDGWGFDDEAVTTTEPTTSKSSIVKPPIDTAGDTEMDEGWDFDLASTSPTTTTAPAQVAPPAAPPKLKAREAKKLGKKIGQKKARLAAQEVHSGSEDVDMASSVYSERSVTGGTSNAGAVSAPVARGTAQADGWGWEEDDQSPAARVGPSPKAATVPTPLRPGATQPKRLHTVVKEEKIAFTDTYLVSKSCRALIDLVQRCLDEATALHTSHTDLNLPSQFADNAYRLVTAASSVLTLFRALIFASPHVSDVPTLGMQLSNDCAWLADHLPAVPILAAADLPTWDREAVVSLMQSASAHAYETQLDTQRTAMLRVIEEMPDLVAIGEDENHRAAMRSVEELKGTIDSLGRVWKVGG